MPVFSTIISDTKVFKGDRIRFEASTSITPDLSLATNTNTEFSFDSGVTWFDVTNKKGRVDWIFASPIQSLVQLKITTTTGSTIFDKQINVMDLAVAKLFSTDDDLIPLEPEVYKYLPAKWDTWNVLHLEAQKQIMQWLDDKGFTNNEGAKYVVADLLDLTEVRELSVFRVLQMIYRGNSNQVGDVFSVKADYYLGEADKRAAKAQIRLDANGDGIANPSEVTNLRSVQVIRG